MTRDIHDIYDVILKIIISVYGTVFLNFMGISGEIEEILSVEITTLTGTKLYLDFLCLLKDGTLCHIEFQYPHAKPEDTNRFFKYNISAEVKYQKRAETYVFNFDFIKMESKVKRIGKTKCYRPIHFFLGDVDFEKHMDNINIKVKSNKALTNIEEIVLMLMPVFPKFKGNAEILKWISNILLKKELFDETKYEFIQAVVGLEIENFLSMKEQKEIQEVVKMTPQAQEVVLRAIHEVNQKTLSEARQDAKLEGILEGKREGKREGILEGKQKAREELMIEIAKAFKNQADINFVSAFTGLSIEEINNL